MFYGAESLHVASSRKVQKNRVPGTNRVGQVTCWCSAGSPTAQRPSKGSTDVTNIVCTAQNSMHNRTASICGGVCARSGRLFVAAAHISTTRSAIDRAGKDFPLFNAHCIVRLRDVCTCLVHSELVVFRMQPQVCASLPGSFRR